MLKPYGLFRLRPTRDIEWFVGVIANDRFYRVGFRIRWRVTHAWAWGMFSRVRWGEPLYDETQAAL